MKNRTQNVLAALVLFLTLSLQPTTAFAQGTVFTYQGQLYDGGAPGNGTNYGMVFYLYDAPTNGNLLGNVGIASVTVSNGLFTVPLSFGSVFDGTPCWLEITVQKNGGRFSVLTPRQALTPTPYAIFAEGASNVVGVVPGGGLSGSYSGAVSFNNGGDSFSGSFAGNGSGLAGVNAAALNGLSASNFWQTAGNAGTTPGVNFLGTTDNHALEMHVNGLRALRLEPNSSGAPNVIGGAPVNYVSNSVVGATIAGGGATSYSGSTYSNSVTATFGTVGGGIQNAAGGLYGTVGGGVENTASGIGAFIGGGAANVASSGASTVGGGQSNTNSGSGATVGGGEFNIASGAGAFIGGGGFDGSTFAGNQAGGAASVIGGGLTNLATNAFAIVCGGSNNVSGGVASTVGGGILNRASGYGATIGGGGDDGVGDKFGNVASGAASTVGGGTGNNATNYWATIAGGFLNFAYGNSATVGGGAGNLSSGAGAVIAGGAANYATNTDATVGGGARNTAGGAGSFVGGGGYDGTTQAGNLASGAASVVGGGLGNSATISYATVGGGTGNTADGTETTVAGGNGNIASGDSSTVGGGNANIASGNSSTVGGGSGNSASGPGATVPAGIDNAASGFGSFAAGYDAHAVHDDSFVWSDGESYYSSDRNKQFKIQAGGGVVVDVSASSGLGPAAFQINDTSANGVGLWVVNSTSSDAVAVFSSGGTGPLLKGFSPSGEVFDVYSDGEVSAVSFNSTSDRNAKENFRALDAKTVLSKVAALPVTEWNYKQDSAAKRHIGPMAQDFQAAFGLNGGDDKHISVMDEGGVALAAIQALNQKLDDKDREMQELRRQNDSLAQQLRQLQSRVESLAERK